MGSRKETSAFRPRCVLVLVEENGEPAIDAAIDMARSSNAVLKLVARVPPVSAFVSLAADPVREERELEAWVDELVRQAVRRVPAEVPVRYSVVRGRRPVALRALIRREQFDVLVLPWRASAMRVWPRLLRSLTAAVLTVPRAGEGRSPSPARPSVTGLRACGGAVISDRSRTSA